MPNRTSRPIPHKDADVLVLDTDGLRGQSLARDLSLLGLSTVVCNSTDDAEARAGGARVLLLRRRLDTTDAFGFIRSLQKKSDAPLRVIVLGDEPNPEDALRAIEVA